jgi:hypothetical protein
MSSQTSPPPSKPTRKTPTQARQGVTPGIVRYVLGVSLTLCILAFAVIYLVGLRL